jgi:DNA polymerase-3 subunit gamma/tau
MEHLALYRKYRPKTFDEVIGQDNITKTLINQVENDEVGHAYLFTGTRGTGKTTCAKIFARAINCLHPKNGSPCGECEVCKALNENNNMDILEIDAASNNGVDEIRDLREKVKYPPVNGKYKVYIIDEVHMLSINAFNALLKTLEEPPSHVVFILATTESYKIPATILSRVMRFDFKLVSIDNLVALLKKIFSQENIKCDEDAYEAIAKAGEGSVRDTLSIADAVSSYAHKDIHYKDVLTSLGISDNKTLIDITYDIINGDINGLLKNINDVYLAGKDISILSRDLTIHFRNLLVIKSCKESKCHFKFAK